MNKLCTGLSLAIVAIAMLAVACSKDDSASGCIHSRPEKVADYLYETTFTSYDWKMARDFASDMDNALNGGACTVLRNGNLIGRNNDCPYCEMAENIIRVPAAEGRYASLAVASYLVDITPKMLEKHPDNPMVGMMPFATTDGINEKAVFCAVNSVPVADVEWTSGTKPGAPELYTAMACRYILDYAASAEEACQLMRNVNLKHSAVFREMHIYVADKTKTFIIETIGNKLFITEPKDGIMTNFYHCLDHYTPHACGIERYELAKSRIAAAGTVGAMHKLMYDLRYSLTYDRSVEPFWYSDFWLDHSMIFGKDITIDTPHEEYDADIDAEIELYKNRKRDVLLNLWITTHSSIYDLDALTLRICAQEDFDHPYCFQL